MTLCQNIETLSMAFLDDELVAEERRELELHLLDCASCRQRVDAERSEISLIRKALVPPPAPALLKARIARALDAEDVAAIRRERGRWSRWLLPGSAMAAAAAALLVVFVGVSGDPRSRENSDVATVVQKYGLPLEVQGASTGPWLRQNFAPVEPPQFTEPGIRLLGGRLLPNGIDNHDAAMLQYLVDFGAERLVLAAFVLKDVKADERPDGQPYQVGGLVLWVRVSRGMPLVTYIDPVRHVGYVFTSEHMTAGELLGLVVQTDLIARAQEQVR
jgi:anti-sigma factor RsiW